MDTSNWIIGSEICCDVVVNDVRISPRHCALLYDSGRWFVEPLEGRIKVDDKMVTGRVEINSTTPVWLSAQIKLPWPSEFDSIVLTVGRATDCDITLDSPGVSGRHARLIIGPQQTIVLEDWDSKNGLRLDGSPESIVKAISLQSISTIYFGASPFNVPALIERAELISGAAVSEATRAAPQPHPISTKTVRKQRASKQTSILTYCLSFFGPTVLFGVMYALGWLPFLSSDRQTPVSASPPMPLPTHVEVVKPVDAPEIAMMDTPSQSSVIAESVVVSSAIIEPPAKSVSPSECVYWVIVKHRETGNWFRLGSAVAVGEKSLLTVASVVQAAYKMGERDYETPSVVHVGSGQISTIDKYRAHAQFAKRLAVADKANADREKILNEKSDDKGSLEKATNLVNVSMSAVSAVDCAILQIAQIDQFLNVDVKSKLRLNQGFRVISSPFPVDEPHWDANSQSTMDEVAKGFSESSITIDGFGLSLEGVPGQSIAILKAAEPDLNWFGCPCINDTDKLMGIVLYAETRQNGLVQLELLSPSLIETMLNEL